MKVEIIYPKTKKDKMIRKIKVVGTDLWSLDTNLAHIIHKCLVKFRKYQGHKGQGYPSEFCSQVNVVVWDDSKENADVQRWLETIDKMIYAFEYCKRDTHWGLPDDQEREFSKEITKIHNKLTKQGIKDHIERVNSPEYDDAYQKYKPLREEHERKIEEGLTLFAKHFRSLWT